MQQGDEVRHTYNSTVHVYKFKQQCGKFLGAVYHLLVYAIMRFAIYKKSRKISYQNQVLRSRLCRGGVEVGGVVGSILSNRIHISQTLSKIGRGPGPPPPSKLSLRPHPPEKEVPESKQIITLCIIHA